MLNFRFNVNTCILYTYNIQNHSIFWEPGQGFGKASQRPGWHRPDTSRDKTIEQKCYSKAGNYKPNTCYQRGCNK